MARLTAPFTPVTLPSQTIGTHSVYATAGETNNTFITTVTVNRSILPVQYHHLGQGNLDAEPMFVFPTNLMSLRPTNPAFAEGFDGESLAGPCLSHQGDRGEVKRRRPADPVVPAMTNTPRSSSPVLR